MNKETTIKITIVAIAVILVLATAISTSNHSKRQIELEDNEIKFKQELETRKLDLKQQEIDNRKAKELTDLLQENERKTDLKNCLVRSFDYYTADWNNACEIEGRDDDCNLPGYRANELEDVMQNNKDNCYKQFSN